MNKFYITTSIVYSNAKPHIGFALELLQADTIARYKRQKNFDVFFLTGTDEHGSKIAKKAEEEKKEPQKFVDEIAENYYSLIKDLNISNNYFIRTTNKEKHYAGVEKVWQKMFQRGDIYKKKYKGLYCVGCEAFVKETELKDGKCPLHNKEPQEVEEENYFFKLSKYKDKIKEVIEKEEVKIIPETRKNEMLRFLEDELEDISISRSAENLTWGIPVPNDKEQTIYVWIDALSNYISALDYKDNGELFLKFWPADVHCVGKDILRFHSIIWVGMLLSLELELPKNIFVHGHITVDGKKMSKSLGNVVDPFSLIEKYGTEAVRYFLLSEISSVEDGDFSEERLKERYNTDLADGLGNLVARTIAMAKKHKNISVVINEEKSLYDNCSEDRLPQPRYARFRNDQNDVVMDEEEKSLSPSVIASEDEKSLSPSVIASEAKQSHNIKIKQKTEEIKKESDIFLDNYKLNEALSSIWKLVHFADKYIEEKKPWEKKDESREVIEDMFFIIYELSELIFPFLPETSEKIKKQLQNKEKEVLFPKI